MERITGNLDISGIKRFQMPGTIIGIKCPKCGMITGVELVDQIYYPNEGDESIAIECEGCDLDTEIERKIDIVSVIVTLDVQEPKIV